MNISTDPFGLPPQSTIEPTQASVRPRWYQLYFLLALLDILTVGISMGLNVQLMSLYSASVELNQTWSVRQEKYAVLATLATEINAPGNNVFDGLDTAVARRLVRDSLEQFNASLAAARNEIVTLASAESAPLLATFDTIDAAMTEMHGEAMDIFGYFDAGETAEAGTRMATMDRKFATLITNIAHLSTQVRTIQQEKFNAQLRSAQEMRRVEYGIFLLVSLMVVGALYYGRRIVVEIKKSAIEQESRDNKILRLNASLEERVQELHSQQEELKQSNEELEEKNNLLADQKVEVEYKNREIEAARLTLEEKAAQLALTSKYKSEFLSSMSHELRTPLTSLLILAQMLAENAEHNLSGQQIEYAKTIQGSGKDLLALISDILDLSKIESGTVTPDLQDVSFATVREQVERAFRHVAESRGIGFGVELAPGLPPSLYTDAPRLQQVMKNLLSNAFKFTQKGQVSVRIAPVESGWSVDRDGLNRAQTVIGLYVTDTGIGLAADKQKIIFEAFQQADTGTARKYGGTGLGLSISREIARLLGGELRLVESQPGKGSTFVLYLPLRAPEPAAKAPPQGSMPQETNSGPSAVADDRAAIKPEERRQVLEKPYQSADSLAGKKVLVVDDDVRNIFALTAVLERHKMAVLSAENGRAALEELGQNPNVDIVLMDIMMPVMDGYETMRQIRQMKQFESLPMIALTAKAMQGDREKCLEAGASDYVSKPVDTDQLLSLLRVWLYR